MCFTSEPQVGPNGTGSIDLTILGGLPPYTISWSNSETTEDIENLQPGVYTAIVTDASDKFDGAWCLGN